MDAELWPVGLIDFSPTAGANSVAGSSLEAIDYQMLSVRIHARKRGVSATVLGETVRTPTVTPAALRRS